MSGLKATRPSAAATAMLTVLLSSATQADTYHFKDVLRPHGHERSLSAKFADGRSCGASGSRFSGDVTAFEQCMRPHGWVVDHYTPDPKPSVGATQTSSTYIDPDTGMSCRDFGGIASLRPAAGHCALSEPEGTQLHSDRHRVRLLELVDESGAIPRDAAGAQNRAGKELCPRRELCGDFRHRPIFYVAAGSCSLRAAEPPSPRTGSRRSTLGRQWQVCAIDRPFFHVRPRPV